MRGSIASSMAQIDYSKEQFSEAQIGRRAMLGGLAAMLGTGTLGSIGYLLYHQSKREERQLAAAHRAIESDYLLNQNGYHASVDVLKLNAKKGSPMKTPYAAISLTKQGEPASAMLHVYGDEHLVTLAWTSGRMYTIDFGKDDAIACVQCPSVNGLFDDEAKIDIDPQNGRAYSLASESAVKSRLEHAKGVAEKFIAEVGKPSALAARVQKILNDAK